MSSVSKASIDRNQKVLMDLAAHPGNDVCADCKTRHPRWASTNLGIFICVACASIHRKIGTHITKVKSLTMDSWTREQVEVMKENGNIKSNAYYNPNEARHPPPQNFGDFRDRDNELEQFIRGKYEYKKFINRASIAASMLGPSRSISSVQPQTTTAKHSTLSSNSGSGVAAHRSSASIPNHALVQEPKRAATTSIPAPTASATSQPRSASQPIQAAAQAPQAHPAQQNGVWSDLVSLKGPSANSSLPLQYSTPGITSLHTNQFLAQQPSANFMNTYQPTPAGGSINAFSQTMQQPSLSQGAFGGLPQSQSQPLSPFGQGQSQPQFTSMPPFSTSASLPQFQASQSQNQYIAPSIQQPPFVQNQPAVATPQGTYLQQTQLAAPLPTTASRGYLSTTPQPLVTMNRPSPFLSSTTPQVGPVPSPGLQMMSTTPGINQSMTPMGTMNSMGSMGGGNGFGLGGGGVSQAPQAPFQQNFVSQMMPPGHQQFQHQQQQQQMNMFGQGGMGFGQPQQQWGAM